MHAESPSGLRGVPRAAEPFLPAVSGALLVFAYEPFSWLPVAFLGFVPLFAWITVRPRTPRALLLGGLAFALPYFLGSTYWFYNLGQYAGPGPGIGALLGCNLLFVATFFSFPVFVRVLQARAPEFVFVAMPFAWVLSEHSRTYGDLYFPWVTIGYALGDWPGVVQHADLVGVYGISLWVVAIAAALARALVRRATSARTDVARPLAVAAALVVLPSVYGHFRGAAIERAIEDAHTIRVSVVQPNVDQGRKWDAASRTAILERVGAMVAEAERGSPDLVVGPEACLPVVMEPEINRLARYLPIGERPILIGAVTGVGEPEIIETPNGHGRRFREHYNSAFLLGPDRAVIGRHDKRVLVPITERIPYAEILGFALPMLRGHFGRFVPGGEPGVLEFESRERKVKTGAIVCYESLFPRLVRGLERDGADLLVNISNDAWFGDTTFPHQHAAFSSIRAIEIRRAVVRAANTGISGFYDPLGRPSSRTALYEEAIIAGDVALLDVRTVYARVGDVAVWMSYAVVGFGLVLAARRRARDA